MFSTARSTKGLGATVEVLYPGYHRSLIMAQNFWYYRFPPVTNDWGTIHHVPDIAPPLQAEEEGPPIKKKN
jgi:hypothetical protein